MKCAVGLGDVQKALKRCMSCSRSMLLKHLASTSSETAGDSLRLAAELSATSNISHGLWQSVAGGSSSAASPCCCSCTPAEQRGQIQTPDTAVAVCSARVACRTIVVRRLMTRLDMHAHDERKTLGMSAAGM